MSRPARQGEGAIPLHYHPCPECGKLFTCEKADGECEKEIARLLRLYPCEGVKRKQPEPGTCVHCGEIELPVSEMEPMATGESSSMCKGCWQAYQQTRKAEILSLLDKWHRDKPKEEATAQSKESEKKLSKSDKKKVEAGKFTLRLVE